MKTIDAGIVGGGLAGLSLSILLARQGKSVVLWEKGTYPSHRVCGEYISKESLPFLKQLLPDFAWNELPQIDQLLVSSVTGRTIREQLGLGGIGISRYLLDASLAAEARRSGVQLLENCPVKAYAELDSGFEVSANSENWHCSTLFLAYGKGRGPGEQARRPKTGRHFLGVKYHIRFPHPADEIQLHNFSGGYCGMSKVEEGISCLCYLVDAARLQACGNDIRKMEVEVLQQNPFLRAIFRESEFVLDMPKVISGVRFGEWGTQAGKAFLLGDAAGSIAPLCGNGMSMALHAASYLGSAPTEAPGHPPGYRYFREQHFVSRIKAGSAIQSFFGSNFLTSAGIEMLRVLPSSLRRKIIRLTHGKPF